MITAKEKFDELMQDEVWREWYMSRPEIIKELTQKYPFEKYRIKQGAPYAITAPGSIVYLQSYTESGFVRVALLTEHILPTAIEHIKSIRAGAEVKQAVGLHGAEGISAHINPKWLEAIE